MNNTVNISLVNLLHESGEALCRSVFEVLVGQIHQLIMLRWLVVGLIVVGTWLGTTLFPVLSTAIPLLILAGVLLVCNLCYAVLEKIGLLAANELHHGIGLGYFPLQLLSGRGVWRNPVYVLGAFLAFVFTVIIAQHLTGMIMVRMTSKEWEAAQNSQRLRAIINAMSEGVLFVTREGQVTLCNSAAQRWLRSSGDLPAVLTGHIETLIQGDRERPDEKIEFDTEGPEPRFIEAGSCEVVGPGQKHLGLIQSQVVRISRILKRMLSLARPATPECRWTDLDELIETTLSLVKFDRRMKGVTIRNEVVQSLPHVWINPLKLN